MGREIRMVPPNWEHPKDDMGNYLPMLDECMEDALDCWIEGYELWKTGKHEAKTDEFEYWEWESDPPQSEYYRPKFKTDATWFQVYETISEGTPVTPPFKTKDELIDYLCIFGDSFDQKRGDNGWLYENAKNFADKGFAMSGMFKDGKFYTARDGA